MICAWFGLLVGCRRVCALCYCGSLTCCAVCRVAVGLMAVWLFCFSVVFLRLCFDLIALRFGLLILLGRLIWAVGFVVFGCGALCLLLDSESAVVCVCVAFPFAGGFGCLLV